MKVSIRILALLLVLLCCMGTFTACADLDTLFCDHVEGEWIVDTAATYDADGLQHKECTLCQKTLRQERIPMLLCSHAETEWIIDAEATFDAEGLRHLECTVCKKTLKTEILAELFLSKGKITAKLEPCLVKVNCYDYDQKTQISQGSGFFIDQNGTFITNAHVVEDCYFIQIEDYRGYTYDVDVMYAYDQANSDYAICQAKSCTSRAVEFSEKVAVGDTVYALGYPNDIPMITVTEGKITSTNAVNGERQFYANTAFIDHGSSGGVLADDAGRVIGITTAGFSDGEFGALKYQEFKDAIENIPSVGKAPAEYFHTVKEIQINTDSLREHFDVIVTPSRVFDENIGYSVFLRMKSKYNFQKLLIASERISVTVLLETEVSYKEETASGTQDRVQTLTARVDLLFTRDNHFPLSTSQHTHVTATFPEENPYSDLKILYDVIISQASGTILLFY